MNKIWFDKEAENWNEALPIGNGCLGAMVFSKTNVERIQVNEDSVWSGGKMDRINPQSIEYYPKVRNLLMQGRIAEAELLAEQSMYATYPHMRHYQTLADVWIDFYDQRGKKIFKTVQGNLLDIEYQCEEVKDYRRELDLDTAVGKTQYRISDALYEREFFSSAKDNVIVYRMKTNHEKGLSFDVSVTRKDNRSGKGSSFCDGTKMIEGEMIRLYGTQGGRDGISFEFLLKVETKGGRKYQMGSHLIVENAQEAILYMTARTTYRSKNPLKWCIDTLKNATVSDFETCKAAHIEDYRHFYRSSSLTLKSEKERDLIPTDVRLKEMGEGIQDTGLINLYYNYGRYLLISSSREGSLPSNLQGIWNEDFEPAWGSKYTININIQMNYWIAEKTGLSRLHMPLLEHLKIMYPNGKETADKMYGMDGFCCHHNTDIWGDCAPQDNHTSSTLWPMGGAWLCLNILEHFQYTRDREFMKEYYPILKDCVKFFLGYLVKDEKGEWISGPSSSPENIYRNEKGESGCLCMGASLDTEIIHDLFRGYLRVTEEMGYPSDLNDEVQERWNHLPKLKIGKYGQIQEWNIDYDEVEPGHRHMSQLFALYPSDQIRMDKTPKLAQAALRTIERRLQYGGGHTGWSKALMVIFYARLWKGEEAFKNLTELLTQATLNNLLNSHPPFQIDGNFGGACGILEMLIQDYGDEVYLLPAVPAELDEGSVDGICLKNGAVMSMTWKDGTIQKMQITAIRDFECTFITNTNECRKILLKKGQRKEG